MKTSLHFVLFLSFCFAVTTRMDDMEFIGESLTDVHDLIREDMDEGTSKTFKELKTDVQRIEYLLKFEKLHTLLAPAKTTTQKDNAKALEFRKAGNALFQKRRYMQALEQYNLAVAYAVNEDVTSSGEPGELVSALGNRSAVLAHRTRYELSIENADMALKFGYPESGRFKLLERKGACHLYLKRPDEAAVEINAAIENVSKSNLEENKKAQILTRLENMLVECKNIKNNVNEESESPESPEVMPTLESTHEQYPHLSKKMKVGYHPDVGRGVIAQEPIKIGETLITELPYASVLYPPFWANHCYHCLKVVIATYPCRSTSCFNFCSAECEQDAWETYMPYEQHLEDVLQKKWCGTIGHLVLRIVFHAGLDALKSSEKSRIREGYEKLGAEEKVSIFLNKNGKYVSDFNTIYNMESQCDSRADMGLFDLSVTSIFLMKTLELVGFIKADDVNNPTIAAGLMHLLEVMQCNALSIPEVKYPTDFEKPGTLEIGTGIYPTGSLLNHSCDPSADWTSFHGDHLVVRAARLLYKGSAATIAYRDRVYYNGGSIALRQAKLKFQYGFNCRCKACVNRWGKYDELNVTLPQYKCVDCRAELYLGIVVDGTSARCEKCDGLQDLQGRVKSLVEGHDLYADAMSHAVGGDTLYALPRLEEYLGLLQQFLCAPWRELTICQAAVQQCYRIQGNKRIID